MAYDFDKHVRARTGLPSRETSKGGDVWTWIREKSEYESKVGGAVKSNLWMVHGKWYDLQDFVKSHPGGSEWLLLTKGQDITEAYEAHHLNFKKTDSILKKYYVSDASSDYVSRYSWDKNGFYPTLKRRVSEYFLSKPKRRNGLPDTHSTKEFIILSYFAVILHFSIFYLTMQAISKWCSSYTVFQLGRDFNKESDRFVDYSTLIPLFSFTTLCGLTLQTFHGLGHNALHMKDNMWMYVYDFCGWKHAKHRISHLLSHHLHPNTDLDLEHPEPWSYVFTSNAGKNSRFVMITGPLYMWSGPLRDIFNLWRGLLTKQEPWKWEYLFNMAQLMLFVYSSQKLPILGAWILGLICFSWMHLVTGFCIETAGFGLHRSAFCWSKGDPHAKYDFGEHCLAATADHDVDMGLFSSLFCFQILNNHGIHHCFPTICKSRMAEIMPIFRATCKEFNVPWEEYPWSDIFLSLWKNWLKGLYTHVPMINTEPQGHVLVPNSNLKITPVTSCSSASSSTHVQDIYNNRGIKRMGAIIEGVQVKSLSREEFREVKKTIEERKVVVFRDQVLTPDEEFQFATRFPHSKTCDFMKFCGPLAKEGFDALEWQKFKLKDRPEIQLRGFMTLNDYYGVTGQLDTGKRALEFHSDSLHEYETPPIFTSLYCRKTPGGDETLFIDTQLAYELLNEQEKIKVESLFVQYRREPQPLDASGLCADFSQDPSILGKLYGDACKHHHAQASQEDVKVSEVHPLVWTHPTTGKKAIISASMWMYRIVEENYGSDAYDQNDEVSEEGQKGLTNCRYWTPSDSHAYLKKLLEPVTQKGLQYDHVWRANDLVYFDNRSLMHSASITRPDANNDRLLHQIILCGNEIPKGPAGQGVNNPCVNPNVTAMR